MYPRLGTSSASYGEVVTTGELVVPGYQRAYSWTLKEVGQIVDDLGAAAGLDGDDVAEDDYFLGTLILLSPAGIDGVPASRDIVDGQQRLITLTIMTAVLRDLGLPDADAANAEEMLFTPLMPDPELSLTTRVKVREQDRDFFANHVQQPGATLISPLSVDGLTLSQSAILEARDHMASLLAQRTATELARLFAYLKERCHFVVIETGDIDKAHRLFSVINDRGMPLQRDQILKAELLRQSPPNRREHITALWGRMETDLGDSFEDLFAHIRTAHGLTKPQIIVSIRQLVERAGGPEPFVDDVFRPLAVAYHRIIMADAPGHPMPADIAVQLKKLSRLTGEDWVPAAMLVLHRYGDDPVRVREMIGEIDRLAHVLRLLCLGSKRRQSRFAKVCAVLRSGPGDVTPDHPVFALSREDIRTVQHHLKDIHTRSLQAAKLVLLRINDELSADPEALGLRPSDVSVEHVLPQRPKAQSEWRRTFADPEERAECTTSLGNLVLVTPKQNELARNEEFAIKKEVYAQVLDRRPPPPITREVIDEAGWNADTVRAREARMLEILSRVLRIELRRGAVAAQTGDRAASA